MVQRSHVVKAAEHLEIDERGLGREERAVLALLLERGRPVGLEAIASSLGLGLETLRDVHEPWLERSGLTERTARGRVATEKARWWYARWRSKASRGRTGIPVFHFPLSAPSYPS